MTAAEIAAYIADDPVSDDESEYSVESVDTDFVLRFQELSTQAVKSLAGKDGVVDKAVLKIANSALRTINLIKILSEGSDDNENDGLGSPDLPQFYADVMKAALAVKVDTPAQPTLQLLDTPTQHVPETPTPPVQISPITAATNQQPTVQTFDPYATYLNEVDSQRAFKERGKLAITTFKAGGDDRALTDRARGIEGRANIGGGEVRFRVTSSACTHSDQYRNDSCRESLVDLDGIAYPCYRYIKARQRIHLLQVGRQNRR
ncbi:hypothetical protein BDY24DRAFT_438486 [Mrakia frigida]|uniref:uncharacterized protein n=1 Tax=Mrakia frigida TaxID=29902 RepID=UPI003FCC13B3